MTRKILLATLCSFLMIITHAQITANNKIYRLVVAFNSIGTGIPDSEPLTAYITTFKKANRIKSITADHIGPLGREGEYKLAFSLKELTKRQRIIFISKIKKIAGEMKSRGNAVVTENEVIDMNSINGRTTITEEKY